MLIIFQRFFHAWFISNFFLPLSDSFENIFAKIKLLFFLHIFVNTFRGEVCFSLNIEQESISVNWSQLSTNSRRRYMAEILPIRRKTLSNQSINKHVASQAEGWMFESQPRQTYVVTASMLNARHLV